MKLPQKEKKVPGYNAFLKQKRYKSEKGKYEDVGYKKVNQEPLSRRDAWMLGARLADQFTQRSFKIRKAGKKAPPTKTGSREYRETKKKFRRKKGDPQIHVERTKHAIDSYNEKLGIPYRSQELRRRGLL